MRILQVTTLATLVIFLSISIRESCANDPDQFLDWSVAYMKVTLFNRVQQRVITINKQFPGPELDTTTNNNIFINVHNNLDEPLLFTWNGIQQRHTPWQDGVLGTNCPILPGKNWTYRFQAKDQIGTYFYYASTSLQKAAGAYGGIRIHNRYVIAVPFPPPADEFTVLIGDWHAKDHRSLKATLDGGHQLGNPDGVLINGKAPFGSFFPVQQGKTYRFRISNVGLATTLNFRIQSHKMLLVETEGSYTQQTFYDSIDIHVGQSYSVLVTANQSPGDFYMVATTRFASPVLNGIAILHYSNSHAPASGPLPAGPAPGDVEFSINQAWSIKRNLTTGAARPNPQGAFHYGLINITRTLKFANSAPVISGKQRFALNDVSYVNPDTSLILAEALNIPNIFFLNSIPDSPQAGRSPSLGTSVLDCAYRAFLEVIFQNNENSLQSLHMDGYSFFVVGFGQGTWTTASRKTYNLLDAISRSTTQVYPLSWTVVMLELDNPGIWNIRSQMLQRQYLGQELYMRVFDPNQPSIIELPPSNVLKCGKALGH